MHKYSIKLLYLTLADLGGALDPPILAPPPMVNPGSTTADHRLLFFIPVSCV